MSPVARVEAVAATTPEHLLAPTSVRLISAGGRVKARSNQQSAPVCGGMPIRPSTAIIAPSSLGLLGVRLAVPSRDGNFASYSSRIETIAIAQATAGLWLAA